MKKIDTGDRRNMFYWQGDRTISEKQVKEIFLDRFDRFDKDAAKKAIELGVNKSEKLNNSLEVLEVGDPINFGSVNTAVFAKLSDDTEVICRMHPREVKNRYFFSESLVAMTAKDGGVKTYETYYVHEADEKVDYDFQLLEKVSGVTLQSLNIVGKENDDKYIRDTGRELAKLHKIETNGFGFFDNEKAKNGELSGYHSEWKEHIYAALDENIRYLVDTGLYSTKTSDNILEIISKNDDLLVCKNPTIVHNDVADWNTLVDPDTKTVTALIDWDESFSGDGVMDFAQWALFFDRNRMKYLIEGYEEISKLDEEFEEKLHLYKMRYIVAKTSLRKKKLNFQKNINIEDKLKFAMKNLEEELSHFGYSI